MLSYLRGWSTRALPLSTLFLVVSSTGWSSTTETLETSPSAMTLPLLLADASTPAVEKKAAPTAASKEGSKEEEKPAVPSPHVVTENVTLISQYLYRGLTQSNAHPALQVGADYNHTTSGFYVGVWASTITWIRDSGFYAQSGQSPSANAEIDVYTGIKNNFANADWGYDVGYLHYDYPGTYSKAAGTPPKPNTNELYAALNWKWISAKYSYSLGDTFGTADAKGTSYIDLTAAIPVRENVTLTLHAGRQNYKGAANSDFSYSDYRAEIAKTCQNNWQIGIGASTTNAKDKIATGNIYFYPNINKNIGRATGYLFVKKTF